MSVRKAVIPIAGRGTRQLPATWAIPKAMMPLVDRDGLAKPIIHLLAAEAFSAGVEEIAVVVSPGQEESIRQYFRSFDADLLEALSDRPHLLAVSDDLAIWGERITCIEQPTPEGFGHAVWCAKDWVGDEPFVLMLGDYLFVSNRPQTCTQQLVEVFERHAPLAVSGMFLCDAETLPRVGVMRGKQVPSAEGLYLVESIVEKPSPERARTELVTPGLPENRWLAHFGNHVFDAEIMRQLDEMVANDEREHGEIQMTASQERLRANFDRYLAYVIDGRAYDAGIPEGWVEAQRALLPR